MTDSGLWRSPLDPERVTSMQVTRWQEYEQHRREDVLTVEEPLEIRLNGRGLAVIMRTPGSDRELAAGFLYTEGIITSIDDILSLEEAADADGLPLANVINVEVPTTGDDGKAARQAAAFERHFAVSASCGLCGKNSIAD